MIISRTHHNRSITLSPRISTNSLSTTFYFETRHKSGSILWAELSIAISKHNESGIIVFSQNGWLALRRQIAYKLGAATKLINPSSKSVRFEKSTRSSGQVMVVGNNRFGRCHLCFFLKSAAHIQQLPPSSTKGGIELCSAQCGPPFQNNEVEIWKKGKKRPAIQCPRALAQCIR